MKMESYRRELRKRIQALEIQSRTAWGFTGAFTAGKLVAYKRALLLTRKIPL